MEKKANNNGNAAEQKAVALAHIALNPKNYRRRYDRAALEDFAAEIRRHGILSPLLLRPSTHGRYELVAGERRYRAAKMAGLKEVPATVRRLTDGEVLELQLAENLQRENPHVLDEAQAVAMLLDAGNDVAEVAARLGKSKAFVHNRMKLAALIGPLREMCYADKFNIGEAIQIAALSPDAQQEFFDTHCGSWEHEGFRLYNLSSILSGFRYDLKRAPFSTKSAKLVPEAGACTRCPFNSATLKSLFPDLANEAVCTNRGCYRNKCRVSLGNQVREAMKEQPDALLLPYTVTAEVEAVLDSIPGLDGLPQLCVHDVHELHIPELPDREDYTFGEEGETDAFDAEGYGAAMEEYTADMEEYEEVRQGSTALRGLYVSLNEARMVVFLSGSRPGREKPVTAKEVQQAIKEGSATPELLQQEIDRITGREERAKELDGDKVQLNIHAEFTGHYSEPANNGTLTGADRAAAKLLIFQTLDYTARWQVVKGLFPGDDSAWTDNGLVEAMANLTEEQYCYLIRMALATKGESKYPRNATSACLYRVAKEAGMDVAAIEKEQQAKAEQRQARVDERVAGLRKRMETLQPETVE